MHSRVPSAGRRAAAITGVATGVGLIGFFAAPAASGATADPQPEVQVVVRLTAPAAAHAVGILGALPGSLPEPVIADRWTLEVPEGEVAATVAHLQVAAGVQYATAAHEVHATALADDPDDPCYVHECGPSAPGVVNPDDVRSPTPGDPAIYGGTVADQYDLAEVHAPQAWAITHGNPDILVAVLDTGVDAEQQDLRADVKAGPDICADDDAACAPQDVNGGNPADTDDNGHGTHVTGTIAAQSDDGVGVASLGWATHAEVFKVLDDSGSGTTTDLATGIYDAVAAGASVINMSLGNEPCEPGVTEAGLCGPDPDTEAAVEYAEAHDVVVVAAAGNDGVDLPSYPAAYPGVLSVAAVDPAGAVDPYSQWGAAADIAAPGDDVVSTWNTNAEGAPSTDTYAVLSGTSMASPHVAAAAALVRAADPGLSAAQVTNLLESTAQPVSGAGHGIDGGLLDAGAAVADAAAAATDPAALAVYSGYRIGGSDGTVEAYGASPYFGDLAGVRLARPVVAIAAKRDETGYWEAATDGGVFTFGSANFYGSTGGVRLARPIVGMAATPDGRGYWMVASDGGVFAFGDAGFYGSTGGIRLDRPVVGMAVTPDGRGYWMVASDGGVFAFGDARFFGSTGNIKLAKPVVGIAATPDGGGYHLVASDGGVFSFGDARFFGSTGDVALARPIVGALGTSNGGGYWLVASDGGVFSFGDARFDGSAGGRHTAAPVIGIA